MADAKLYRIFIDEVGDHGMKNFDTVGQRYLSLFGVIVEDGHMRRCIEPEMQRIKAKYFQGKQGEAIIFHRADLTQKKRPFHALRDALVQQEFTDEILDCYSRWDYTAIVVAIDKDQHLQQYGEWRFEPYHYCFKALLERYVQFLRSKDGQGDVLIEARDQMVDRQLKLHFRELYNVGTGPVPSTLFRKHLTSNELKLKTKKADVCGLQLADMLAVAAHYDLLVRYRRVESHDSAMGRAIAQILERSKYRRSWLGAVDGYGRKMLP